MTATPLLRRPVNPGIAVPLGRQAVLWFQSPTTGPSGRTTAYGIVATQCFLPSMKVVSPKRSIGCVHSPIVTGTTSNLIAVVLDRRFRITSNSLEIQVGSVVVRIGAREAPEGGRSAMPAWWSCSRQRDGKGKLGRLAYLARPPRPDICSMARDRIARFWLLTCSKPRTHR